MAHYRYSVEQRFLPKDQSAWTVCWLVMQLELRQNSCLINFGTVQVKWHTVSHYSYTHIYRNECIFLFYIWFYKGLINIPATSTVHKKKNTVRSISVCLRPSVVSFCRSCLRRLRTTPSASTQRTSWSGTWCCKKLLLLWR